MNKLHSLFILFILLGQFGCATNTQFKETPVTVVVAESRVKESFPSWVLNPIIPGHLAVVGAAPRQTANNDKWQLLAAELNAQAELAKQIDLYIDHSISVKRQVSNGKLSSEIESEEKQISIQGLDLSHAEVLEKWVSHDGTLYILYVLTLDK